MYSSTLALSAIAAAIFQATTSSAYAFTLGVEIYQQVNAGGAVTTQSISTCSTSGCGTCGNGGGADSIGKAHSTDITNPNYYGTTKCPDGLCVTFNTSMSDKEIRDSPEGTKVGTIHDNSANVDMNCVRRDNTDCSGTNGQTFINVNNIVECDPSF